MAKKTTTDYIDLGRQYDLTWCDDSVPPNIKANTLWRCAESHLFPRSYGNLYGRVQSCPVCKGGHPRLVDAYSKQLTKYFDPSRNPDVDINLLMCGSNKRIILYCKKHNHEWKSQPVSIIKPWSKGRSGCRFCSGKTKRSSTDYHALAKRRGFTWLGKSLPQNNKAKTDWRCDKNHDFSSTFNQLDRGFGCLYCAGKAVSGDNNLAVMHPDVAKLWHSTRNEGLLPEDVVPGSHSEFWWQCSENPELHEWEAQVKSVVRSYRTGNNGCPFCSGQRVHREESLGAKHQELVNQWHPTKNGRTTPFDISYGSGVDCWWQCEFGHTWKASPNSRTSQGGRGCPKCSNQTSKLEIRIYVELKTLLGSAQWRNKISGRECDILLPDARIAIEVDGHKWHHSAGTKDKQKTAIFSKQGLLVVRVREKPLPKLSEYDVLFDKQAKHSAVLRQLTETLAATGRFSLDERMRLRQYGSEGVCVAESEYRMILAQLPKPPAGDSLFDKVPESGEFWDYEANSPLLPDMFTAGSHKRIYWQCVVPYHPPNEKSIKDWVTTHRSNGRNCPYCRGSKVAVEDSLAVKFPAISNEFSGRNGMRSDEAWPKWTRKFWWQCTMCRHEWQASIYSRTQRPRPTGCPNCGNRVPVEHAI